MATTLVVNPFKCNIGWDLESTNSFGTNTVNQATFSSAFTYTNGSGAGKAQVLYAATLTIATGATTTLDINATTGTPIKDPLGNSVILAKVKGIYVAHTTVAATGTLELAGTWFIAGPLTGTTPKLIMYPGMTLFLGGGAPLQDNGWATTDGSADTFTLKNNDAASITVNVALFGE